VCRTDIKGYYAAINKLQLLGQLAQYIAEPFVLNLLSQYLFYCIEDGGNFYTPAKGICRGCSLSPLMAGFQLYELDKTLAANPHIYYVRFMDDFLILSKTRWQLRKAVKTLNQHFEYFGFKQHPDKTTIGSIYKGFDWMGYQFKQQGLCGVAPRTLEKFAAQLRRLYEQTRTKRHAPSVCLARVVRYVQRWLQWWQAGLLSTVGIKPTSRQALRCSYVTG
jgi:RNA-directed DNA polymerase